MTPYLKDPEDALAHAILMGYLMDGRRKDQPGAVIERLPESTRQLLRELTSRQAQQMRKEF